MAQPVPGSPRPPMIGDAPAGFVSTVQPTRSRLPLVGAAVLVAVALALAAYGAVRLATEPGKPFIELTPRELDDALHGLCDEGDRIDGAIPHVPGAALQGGVHVLEDERHAGVLPFTLDQPASDELVIPDHAQVTVAGCVRVIDATEELRCEARPGEFVSVIVAEEYEVRYVELRTAEELDQEVLSLRIDGCPGALAQGISDAIEDQPAIELRRLMEDRVQEGARRLHHA